VNRKANAEAGRSSLLEKGATAPDETKPLVLASLIFPGEEILGSGLVSSLNLTYHEVRTNEVRTSSVAHATKYPRALLYPSDGRMVD